MTSQKLTFKEFIKFYLPLVVNSGIIIISAPLFNYGITLGKEVIKSIAAFSAGFSIMLVINAFIFVGQKIGTALIKDKKSFIQCLKYLFTVAFVFSLIGMSIALTPLGTYIFSYVFNLPSEISNLAKEYMIIASLLPVIACIRVIYQSVLIIHKTTQKVAIGTFIRQISGFSLLLLGVLTDLYPVHLAAALGIVGGSFIEDIYLFITSRRLLNFEKMTRDQTKKIDLTFKKFVSFSTPMWLSSMAWSVSYPVMVTIIGFTTNPTLNLAGFGILRSLGLLLLAPFASFSVATLVLGDTNIRIKNIQKIFFTVTLLYTLILGLFTLFGADQFILNNIYSLRGEIMTLCLLPISLLFMLPIPRAIMGYFEGRFLKEKHTRPMGVASILRIVNITVIGMLLIRIFPNINGVLLGVVLMFVANISDASIVGLGWKIFSMKSNKFIKLSADSSG